MIYKISKYIAINFYVIFCAGCFLECVGLKTPLIVIAKAFCIVFAFLSLSGKVKIKCKGSALLSIVGVYALLSGLNYLTAPQPVSFFLNGLQEMVWPTVFYIFAFVFTDDEVDLFRKRTIQAFLFSYIVGLYLYFANPGWYVSWRISSYENWLGNDAENYVMAFMSFTSFFFHTYVVGYTAFCLLAYFMRKIYIAKDFPKKEYIAMIICVLVSFFTQQRIAVVLSVLLAIVYMSIEAKYKKYRVTKFFIPVIICAIVYIGAHLSDFEVMLARYMTVIDGSVLDDGRGEQWQDAFRNFDSWIFGKGLNIVGHPAAGTNYPCIADGEFFKNLYELGIVGCVLFYSFCLATIRQALKNKKKYSVEIPILIGFICMEYGANPFEMGNIIPFYWFAAGLVWRGTVLNK